MALNKVPYERLEPVEELERICRWKSPRAIRLIKASPALGASAPFGCRARDDLVRLAIKGFLE